MKVFLLKIIKFYQRTISPDHACFPVISPFARCRFFPSCSEYSLRVISKYGIARGLAKSFWRVLRCNPLSKGGVDYE